MPKATKTATLRPSPVAETPKTSKTPKTTTPKPRKPSMIVSDNHDLPTVAVDADVMEDLKSLKTRRANENSYAVSFNALFNRQNKFGGWEFSISDSENETLQEVIKDQLDFVGGENTNSCISLNDYTGHYQIRGKLSKAYKDSADGEKAIPIPENGSIVSVTGRLETSKIKGKETCYLQIDNMELVVSA